jgi:hypothetical protein
MILGYKDAVNNAETLHYNYFNQKELLDIFKIYLTPITILTKRNCIKFNLYIG